MAFSMKALRVKGRNEKRVKRAAEILAAAIAERFPRQPRAPRSGAMGRAIARDPCVFV
jgi:hypothetical protein